MSPLLYENIMATFAGKTTAVFLGLRAEWGLSTPILLAKWTHNFSFYISISSVIKCDMLCVHALLTETKYISFYGIVSVKEQRLYGLHA